MITKRSKLLPEFNKAIIRRKETFYRKVTDKLIALLFRKELIQAEKQIDLEIKQAIYRGWHVVQVELVNFPSTAFSHVTERVKNKGWNLLGASGGGSNEKYVVKLNIKL
jgi:hypothetical protein